MKLWNDYEGKLFAESYPLKKLLRPEGRSAFFLTSAQDGAADVIRITESLNDEHEMLERWRQVSEVHQANLVEIKTYGTTTFDGVPLMYALLEATDGSLAEILAERPLTVAETMQVATSGIAALAALHAIGLIHEHVEAASIVASGEVVKLRSDCVRECRMDPEFNPQSVCDELRQRDVHDLAMLLLQCLTLERQWTSAVRVPAPFDQVIRHGLDGTWGLAEMSQALQAPALPRFAVAEPVPAEALDSVRAFTRPQELPASEAGTRVRVQPEIRTRPRRLHLRRLVTSTVSLDLFPKRWLVAGIALVAVLLGWFLMKRTPVAPPARPELAQPSATEASGKKGTAIAVANTPSAPATAPMQPGWHVIAYTYLHESQAAAKAAFIGRKHPGLRPKVFAPAGHSPYFVALGGGMSQSEAAGVLRTARRDGLPRDTFIRLYRSR